MSTKLVVFIIGGTTACFGVKELFHRALNKKIKESPLYKESIDFLKSHGGALQMLGEPIEDSDPSLSRLSLFFNGMIEFHTKVKGPKDLGILYVTALGEDTDSLKLDSIYLELSKHRGKRLIVKEPDPRLATLSCTK